MSSSRPSILDWDECGTPARRIQRVELCERLRIAELLGRGSARCVIVAGSSSQPGLGLIGSGRVTWSPAAPISGRCRAASIPPALNLVVITLDTTRADRLGPYGRQNAGTPNLDALAQDGVLFDHASTAAPITLPAHSSLFTGRFPPQHGVRDNGGYFLSDKEQTLAETLKARGYATGGFIAAYVLDSKWGIAQGFDTYFDDFDLSKYKVFSMGAIQRPGNEVVDKALPWIDQHRAPAVLRLGAPLRRPRALQLRPSRSRAAIRAIPTRGRSRSPTRRSAASCSSSAIATSSIAR